MFYELGSSLKNCLLVFYTAQKQGTEPDKRYLSLLVDLVNLLVLQLSKGLILLCCFHHFNDFCYCSMDWLSTILFYTLLLLASLSVTIHISTYVRLSCSWCSILENYENNLWYVLINFGI